MNDLRRVKRLYQSETENHLNATFTDLSQNALSTGAYGSLGAINLGTGAFGPRKELIQFSEENVRDIADFMFDLVVRGASNQSNNAINS